MQLRTVLNHILEESLNNDLRNASGRLIGRIRVTGTMATLEDATGKRLGTYDLRDDVTRDAAGRKVGTGNGLSLLLRGT
jgi:hypothetical protein